MQADSLPIELLGKPKVDEQQVIETWRNSGAREEKPRGWFQGKKNVYTYIHSFLKNKGGVMLTVVQNLSDIKTEKYPLDLTANLKSIS